MGCTECWPSAINTSLPLKKTAGYNHGKLVTAASSPVPCSCQVSVSVSYRCGAPCPSMAHAVPSQPAAMSVGAPNVSLELMGEKAGLRGLAVTGQMVRGLCRGQRRRSEHRRHCLGQNCLTVARIGFGEGIAGGGQQAGTGRGAA
jgi:hypothetical protein